MAAKSNPRSDDQSGAAGGADDCADKQPPEVEGQDQDPLHQTDRCKDQEQQDPKNVQELTSYIQNMLQQMQDRFQTMSDQIVNRIDDMAARIDDLEHNINDLVVQAGQAEVVGSGHQQALAGPGLTLSTTATPSSTNPEQK